MVVVDLESQNFYCLSYCLTSGCVAPDWLVGLNLETYAGAQAAALLSGFGCCALSASPSCAQLVLVYLQCFDQTYLAVDCHSQSLCRCGGDYQYSMNQLMR